MLYIGKLMLLLYEQLEVRSFLQEYRFYEGTHCLSCSALTAMASWTTVLVLGGTFGETPVAHRQRCVTSRLK
jgi:hypothetical protein